MAKFKLPILITLVCLFGLAVIGYLGIKMKAHSQEVTLQVQIENETEEASRLGLVVAHQQIFPQPFSINPDLNAFPKILEISSQIAKLNDPNTGIHYGSFSDLLSDPWLCKRKDVNAIYQRAQPLIQQIITTTKLPFCYEKTDPNALTMNISLDILTHLRVCDKLLLLGGYVALINNQPNQFRIDMEAAHKLATYATQQKTIVNMLVAMSLDAMNLRLNEIALRIRIRQKNWANVILESTTLWKEYPILSFETGEWRVECDQRLNGLH